MADFHLPHKAITCGSDLRALKPREMLGCFVGLRARHMKDIGEMAEAERDYLLARHLFPANRYMYYGATWTTINQSAERFDDGEVGSSRVLAHALVKLNNGECSPDDFISQRQLNAMYHQFIVEASTIASIVCEA